ncbi:MAG: hypothetical protein ACI4SK_05895 [Christensenellales bacterium]
MSQNNQTTSPATEKFVTAAKATAKKAVNILIGSAVYLIALAIVYLIVTFTVKDSSSKSWLILAGGALIGLTGLSVFFAVKNGIKKRFLFMRVFIACAIVLSIIAAYLIFSVVAGNVWKMSWMLFLFLPIMLTGADLICCVGSESKFTVFSLEAFIITASVMTYVILGLTGFMPWHPGWLLPVIAFLITAIIALVALKSKLKGRSKTDEKP